MIANTNLSVRVCGVVVARLKVRREVQDGEYTGWNEIAFEDPVLGFMPLDDSLTIELKRLDVPFEDRVWELTDTVGLYALLVEAGAVPPS
jgi:hypothetical protein